MNIITDVLSGQLDGYWVSVLKSDCADPTGIPSSLKWHLKPGKWVELPRKGVDVE